jgi:hypothetical protein
MPSTRKVSTEEVSGMDLVTTYPDVFVDPTFLPKA